MYFGKKDQMKKKQPVRFVLDFGAGVSISPPIWPDCTIDVQPGDLSKFAPKGTGVYGYQEEVAHPFLNGPIHEAESGILYFDNDIRRADLKAILRIFKVED